MRSPPTVRCLSGACLCAQQGSGGGALVRPRRPGRWLGAGCTPLCTAQNGGACDASGGSTGPAWPWPYRLDCQQVRDCRCAYQWPRNRQSATHRILSAARGVQGAAFAASPEKRVRKPLRRRVLQAHQDSRKPDSDDPQALWHSVPPYRDDRGVAVDHPLPVKLRGLFAEQNVKMRKLGRSCTLFAAHCPGCSSAKFMERHELW